MHLIIRRSCQFASQQGLRFSAPRNGAARRAFSQSNACQRGQLPRYLDSSNPELAGTLAQLNSKVLLPEHLNKEQKQLVYKQANRTRLEAEPIEITLGDVTLPLEHIDRNRDQPARWEVIKQVVEKSETPEDWENVVRMMEGFHDAGIKIRTQWFQMIVRKLNKAKQQHLVLKALQRVNKTGLRLRDEKVAVLIMKGLRSRAAEAEWDEAETSKMLRFAEQVIEMMEEATHVGKARAGVTDVRASPFVITVPLELAAVMAKKHAGGQDTDGKVKKYASRLMNAMQQGEFLTAVLPKYYEQIRNPASKKDGESGNNAFAERIIIENAMKTTIPLWNALVTANAVLGADMPSADVAQKTAKEIRDNLTEGQAAHKARRGESTPNLVDHNIELCEKL